MRIIIIILISLFLISNIHAADSEKLFYITPNNITDSTFTIDQLKSIKDHANAIDIIAPQIYSVNANGEISGTIDPKLIAAAKENNLKIMPLLVNPNFDQELIHTLLHNPAAQEKAIANMLALCEKYHFYGLQFDFENINVNDKAEFTRFYQLTATQLHQKGYAISIAVVPRISDSYENEYERWYFENWSGAYDYQSLAQSSDFISVMTYDRHTSLTTPGPVAAIDWVEKNIQSLLKVIPANKLSLGIPDYSGYWSTGKVDPGHIPERYTYRSKEKQIPYEKVTGLLNQYNLTPAWQEQWKSSYLLFSNNDRNEYLFIEDAKAFQAKLELAQHYQLRGISVWKLGFEDPKIWTSKK